jgi:hypothetical protein
LNLEASRVVEAVEGVEELIGTEVQYSETSPNTIEIIAFYKNDEDYIREISE